MVNWSRAVIIDSEGDYMNYADFLTYFRQMINQETKWTSGNSDDPEGHPQYDQKMIDFADEFKRTLDYDPNYRKTLWAADIEPKIDHETMGEVMLANSPKLVKAMLSMVIDGENLHKGTWADALREGFFFQLVSALSPATVIAG